MKHSIIKKSRSAAAKTPREKAPRGLPPSGGDPLTRARKKVRAAKGELVEITQEVSERPSPLKKNGSGAPIPPPPSPPPPREEKPSPEPKKRGFWEEDEEDLDEDPPEMAQKPPSRIILPPRPRHTPLTNKELFGTEDPPSEEYQTRVIRDPLTEKDRGGVTYKEALAIQAEQLARWKRVLAPSSFKRLQDWCEKTNAPTDGAPWPGGRHQVPRGQELVNFLLEV